MYTALPLMPKVVLFSMYCKYGEGCNFYTHTLIFFTSIYISVLNYILSQQYALTYTVISKRSLFMNLALLLSLLKAKLI